MRAQACSGSWNLGLYSVNSIAVDQANTLVACAVDNCNILLLDPSSNKVGGIQHHNSIILSFALFSGVEFRRTQ